MNIHFEPDVPQTTILLSAAEFAHFCRDHPYELIHDPADWQEGENRPRRRFKSIEAAVITARNQRLSDLWELCEIFTAMYQSAIAFKEKTK